MAPRRRRRGHGLSVIQIKDAVRKRDGYRCTQCGMTNAEHRHLHGRSLEVHRKTPGSLYAADDSCVTLCIACHGPQPRRRRGQPDLANPHVHPGIRVDACLLRKARQVIAFRVQGPNTLKLVDYLDAILRPVITQDHADMIDRIVREGGRGKKGGGKP